jgi:hypothetical protein
MNPPPIIAAAALAHPLNWYAGWGLVLAGFLSGAVIGLRFHRPDFLGGYDALPRRMVRLGHIALAALGMMNVLFALSPIATGATGGIASAAFLAGGLLMPAVCFLTAWRATFRHLFFLPVLSLLVAVVFTLMGVSP